MKTQRVFAPPPFGDSMNPSVEFYNTKLKK
jgi:hypothetical protein